MTYMTYATYAVHMAIGLIFGVLGTLAFNYIADNTDSRRQKIVASVMIWSAIIVGCYLASIKFN